MRLFLITGILLTISLSACDTDTQPSTSGTVTVVPPARVAPAPTQTSQPAVQPASPLPASYAYHIGVGDEIEVKFFFTPELNDRLTVRPDGKISIMFAQDVQAAGLTAEQLATSLKQLLASHIKQLDLVVIVRTFASQKVFVSGEVAKPGPVQLLARENLLQVLNDAGWITPAASREKVLLVRRGYDGKDAIYTIDFQKILSGQDMSQNISVQAGDLLLIPPSDITQLDRWIDQNIRQIIPFTAGVGVYVNGGGR